MQTDNIIEKARRLGLDTGSSSSSADNLRTIASQVGLNDFNSITDVDKLESILDQKLSEQQEDNNSYSDEIANSNEYASVRDNSFGQKEYDQAKKNGVYDSNHYKAKQQELDKKAEELNNERHNNTKPKKGETGPAKADGSNTVRKSKMDRVMDNLNYAKAKKDAISNKIDGAKADIYDATHPLEHAKDAAKAKAKDTAKQAGKAAAAKGKAAASALGKKLIAAIASNPYILVVILAIFVIIVIIIIIFGTEEGQVGYYNQTCDFNISVVNLTYCDESDDEPLSLSLKEYVLGATYSIARYDDYSDEALKALMIIVKTNALSLGEYDNSTKMLPLSTCDYSYYDFNSSNDEYARYDELYSEIENYLYLSASYDSSIDSLGKKNELDLGDSELEILRDSESNYNTILNELYNDGEYEDIVYTSNLFIGDARIKDMRDYGIVASGKTIYASSGGLGWLSGTDTNMDDATNAANGVIDAVREKIKENTKYNLIIWLGLNDLGNVAASQYFEEYLYLAQNDWSNYHLYIIEVGPVGSKANVSNDTIFTFNKELKRLIKDANLDNLSYVDILYNMGDGLPNNGEFIEDGILYDSVAYDYIYRQMVSSADKSSNISSLYKLYDLDDYCEYIIVDNDGESNYCESMSISSSTLSKDEFVTKVTSYFSNISGNYANDFVENASLIYNLAVNNNINPELVIVRASVEGYSPVSKGYTNYYNYWGIGCYNGASLSSCTKYSSFEDGVLGFINTISKYDSLSAMSQKYAYIGSYWYNPGGSGSGGCYYFPYIKKYMSSTRTSEVENACQSSKVCEGSACLKTTTEDQTAYSMYQVDIMTDKRNSIFNISSDLCEGYSQTCTIYVQGDSRWSSTKLGSSSTNMGESGCAVASLATGLSCSGTKLTIANFDAGKFIDALNEGKCFSSSGNINWSCSAIKKIAPDVRYLSSKSQTNMKNLSVEAKKAFLEELGSDNYIVLVHFTDSSHPRGHFVALSQVNNDYVVVKDPYDGKSKNLKISLIDSMRVFSLNGDDTDE